MTSCVTSDNDVRSISCRRARWLLVWRRASLFVAAKQSNIVDKNWDINPEGNHIVSGPMTQRQRSRCQRAFSGRHCTVAGEIWLRLVWSMFAACPTRLPVVLYNFALITSIRSVCSLPPSLFACLLPLISVTRKALCKLRCNALSRAQFSMTASVMLLRRLRPTLHLHRCRLKIVNNHVRSLLAALLYWAQTRRDIAVCYVILLICRPASLLYFSAFSLSCTTIVVVID